MFLYVAQQLTILSSARFRLVRRNMSLPAVTDTPTDSHTLLHILAACLVWHHDRIPPPLVPPGLYSSHAAQGGACLDGQYGLPRQYQVVGAEAQATPPVSMLEALVETSEMSLIV